MEATEKTLTTRHDAYKHGMDNFTMLRYTAAMESLNATLEATLQDEDRLKIAESGGLSCDSISHTSAILAAADMLGGKMTAIDKSIQNLSMLVGRGNVLDGVNVRLESISEKLGRLDQSVQYLHPTS